MSGHSLDEFIRAHDPKARVATPETVYTRELPKGCRRFIVTAAQNATPVNEPFLRCLENMARQRQAELLVIPLRYKNPTSHWTGSQRNAEWWDPSVRPYLWNQRHALNKNLTLLADFKVQPTASAPLTGAEAISHESSGIIGHTKMQMRSIPTRAGRMAKLLTTTGVVTVENYTSSRAGKIGAFHHSLSAIVVELDGSWFHLRQVHFDAKTKTVTDLDRRYGPEKHGAAPRALAVVMGDTHRDSICPLVERATFGPGGIMDTLRPRYRVWHDLLDGYACNPHHFGNPLIAVAKAKSGAGDVKGEVMRAIDYVRKHTPEDSESIVVASNHNDFLARWVKGTDWKMHGTNAEFYLETALALVRSAKHTRAGTVHDDPFAYWMRQAQLARVRVLDPDESFVVGGVELSLHGENGPNGARGSIKNLRRIGIRTFIGHGHSPGIDEGAYQVGTSTELKLEYTRGPSSWLNTHGVVHEDGKRQLINIIKGDWRA